MPQMGESIAEGTIVRWIKKVGDAIDKDEPLFEISTDKVDAEIPSPGAGVLLEIKVKEGETVPVNSVVAVIGADGEKPAASAASRRRPSAPAAATLRSDGPDGSASRRADERCACRIRRASAREAARARRPPSRRRSTTFAARARRRSCGRSRRSTASTSRNLNGTGISGRVTKKDIADVHRARRPARRPARRRAGAAPTSRRQRRRSRPARTCASRRWASCARRSPSTW